MASLFYWVLNISILGGVTGTVIVLLRLIKKIPRRVIFLLWSIPLLRFWFPFGLRNEFSLLAILSVFWGRSVSSFPSREHFAMHNFLSIAERYFPLTLPEDGWQDFFLVTGIIWICGAAVLFIGMMGHYWRIRRQLRNALPLGDHCFATEHLLSPAVFGILHPKIYFPKDNAEREKNWVLLHEKEHIRRRDHFWRFLGIVTCCIHWFNPLAWFFLSCAIDDMEYACDEGVVRRCGPACKKEYALALAQYHSSASSGVSFRGGKLRKRVLRILHFRKLSLYSGVAMLVFLVAIFIFLLTNAG